MTLTYQESLDYLYSFINYEHKSHYAYSDQTFDLARLRTLLAELGNPQEGLKCLHIAGTKGKGSVAAMCESVLRVAGYRVGFYTSPHLQDFRERIQIDRQLIPEADFAAAVERIRPAVERHEGITWFEIVTALALVYFEQQHVDIAVLEVGLGGRLDATNVVLPQVAVISSISYDHVQLLGSTLAEIAAEKAGIVKPGVPAVVAPQVPEADAVLRRIAAEQGAPLVAAADLLEIVPGDMTPEGQHFSLRPRAPLPSAGRALPQAPSEWYIPLAGQHQSVNASVALLALDVLAARGWKIDAAAMRAGLERVNWAGRFQLLSRAPVVVLDAAHNVDSAEKLARTLDALYAGRPLTLVFGASGDKDIPGMLRILVPRARRVVLTRAANVRAADPEELAAQVNALGVPAEVTGDPAEALERALDGAGLHDVLLFTGSIFVVGAVADAWQRRALR